MSYTGFRFGGRNATLARPTDKPPVVTGDTWARDRSSAGADDGTELDATFANRLKANLEALVTGLGGDLNDGDEQLLNAVLVALAQYTTSAALATLLAAKAPLASPALSGAPTAPTAVNGTSTQQLATTAFVQEALAAMINGAPGALDQLSELAAALGNDSNFAATMTNALAGKLAKASNLSDLTDAAAARGNLGLAIGTHVQAYHALLAAIAGLTIAKGTLIVGSGAGALAAVAAGADGKIMQWDSTQAAGVKFIDLPSGLNLASQAQAEAGTDDAAYLSSLKARYSIDALAFVATRNAWINGGFEVWQRGSSSLSCPAGARTFRADRTYVKPSGAAVTQQRASSTPSGARSRYGLQITGATSVTTVLIGQRIEAAEVPPIKRSVTLTAKIYNGSGASFTPSLLIGTPEAEDDFTTVTNQLTQALQACTDGQWTTVAYTVDVSAYTNVGNGLQIEWLMPTGALNTGAKTIILAEVSVGPNTTFAPMPVELEIARCQRFYLEQRIYSDWGNSSSNAMAFVSFPRRMRAAPTQTNSFAIAPSNMATFVDGVNYQWAGTISAGSAASGLAKFSAEL